MTNEDYKIISTSCPILNIYFRAHRFSGGSPSLDVLLKLEEGNPTEIICPHYQNKGACEFKIKEDSSVNDSGTKCIYSVGWRSLK